MVPHLNEPYPISLPKLMDFKLFWADHLLVAKSVDSFWPIHSGTGHSNDLGPHTVDGCEIHFAPLNETKVEAITFVGIYVGESNHSRVSWVVRNGYLRNPRMMIPCTYQQTMVSHGFNMVRCMGFATIHSSVVLRLRRRTTIGSLG